jgi:hypothetical protein
VGGVVGGVAGLAIIAAAIAFLILRNKRNTRAAADPAGVNSPGQPSPPMAQSSGRYTQMPQHSTTLPPTFGGKQQQHMYDGWSYPEYSPSHSPDAHDNAAQGGGYNPHPTGKRAELDSTAPPVYKSTPVEAPDQAYQ